MLLPPPTYVPASAFTWPSALIVWGPGSWSARHRHHCVQLVMALRGTLRMRVRERQRWTTCGALLVKPDAWHEVDARETDVLIAFVEPESDFGAALLERLTTDVTPIADRPLNHWRRELGAPNAVDKPHVERWVTQTLLHGRTTPRLDPRITRAMRYLRDNLSESTAGAAAAAARAAAAGAAASAAADTNADALSLESVARTVGLSPSRFLHLFTASIGIPMRPYILWLRLQRAVAELAQQKSVTEAAHTAGFADAAHLTRTFRRMLGATPRQILTRGLAARDVHV